MKLPLPDVPVAGYQHHAYRLSIMAQHADFYPWFYCNYIQLTLIRKPGVMPRLDFYEFQKISPLLRDYYTTKSMVTPYTSLTAYLRDRIDEGKYIITFANEYYVPERYCHQKFHNAHDILLFGYDADKEVFHAAGYNDKSVYGTVEIGYGQMEKALLDFGRSEGELLEWADGIHLYEPFHKRRFDFDKGIMLEQMKEYLYSQNSSNRFRMYENTLDYTFGLAVYDDIAEYLRQVRSHALDVRIFHILYEHKKVMVDRLRFLMEDQGLPLSPQWAYDYEKVLEQSLLLRNLCIRLGMSKDRETIHRMIDLLDQMKEAEARLLDGIISDLQ